MVGRGARRRHRAATLRVRGVRPPAARRAPLRRGRRHRRGCSSRSSGSGSARRSSRSSPGSSTTTRSTGWPTTASPATSTATPRASCTSPARRSSPSPARSPTRCCWRRWRCRSSTTTARSRRPRPGWSPPPPAVRIIEMGSRRTHEEAAVAAARAAYLAGFAATSNLEAERRHGIPTAGTAAHACVLLHDDELTRVPQPGRRRSGRRPRCSSTPTTSARASNWPSQAAGPGLGAIRIDSGDLGVLARQARDQLDALGATGHEDRAVRRPRRVRDRRAARRAGRLLRGRHLGRHRLRRADRRDGLQAGRGRRRPVAKRSASKESRGGRKSALRRYKPTGTAIEEVVYPAAAAARARPARPGRCRSR